jgi:hypothetical protein
MPYLWCPREQHPTTLDNFPRLEGQFDMMGGFEGLDEKHERSTLVYLFAWSWWVGLDEK